MAPLRGLLIAALLPALTAAEATARTHVEARPAVEQARVDAPVVDQLIRLRLGVRDLFVRASARLAALAQSSGFRVPDLTILTTQPLGDSPSTWATSGFGWREDPIRKRRKWHGGADVRAKRGTPVAAAGDGIVVFAGRQGGYGNIVYVDHGGGVITRYAHLSRILVKRDAALAAGQTLGHVGATGRATGSHLHFEVRLDGRAVDPGTAMTVGELQRESPAAGHLAAFALTPEMQALEVSDLDPPRARATKKGKAKGPRPDRANRTKVARPVS